MKYPVNIHKDDETGYGVTIPDIPGCFSYGDTQEEAILNRAHSHFPGRPEKRECAQYHCA